MNTAGIIPVSDDADGELERQGIVRIATERFEVDGYRYDRLSDAVAEARRRNALGSSR